MRQNETNENTRENDLHIMHNETDVRKGWIFCRFCNFLSRYEQPIAYPSRETRDTRPYPSRNHEEPRRFARPPSTSYREPAPLPQMSFPSSRQPKYSSPPARYAARRPPRDEYLAPSRDYDSRRLPPAAHYESRRRPSPPRQSFRLPPASNGYHRDTLPPPPIEKSPVRGELLPTTIKYMNQPQASVPAPHRPSPPLRYSNTARDYSEYPRKERSPLSSRPVYRRSGYPPSARRRPSPSLTSRPYRSTRPTRGRGLSSRGRGAPRGGRSRVDVSPIRAAGEYDNLAQGLFFNAKIIMSDWDSNNHV